MGLHFMQSHFISSQCVNYNLIFYLFFFLIFYWILGFGVHERSMQDSCVGTHMAVCFSFLLPFTRIWHFSPRYPSPAPHPPLSLTIPHNRPQCVVLPSLCPCVLIFPHPSMSENMWYFIFCSCVSLLRMTFSRFIHVPTKDANSSFLIAAQYSMVYMCHIFPVQSIINGHLG